MDDLAGIYDDFAPEYDRGRILFDNTAQLEMLAGRIPSLADVLDAGCGSGTPVLHFFSERGCRVTGTDISPAMLELAAVHVPEARLVEVDSAALGFKPESFDLVSSFYSLFHLTMEKQRAAFVQFFRVLRPGGLAYFTLASDRYTGESVFCGTKKFAGAELPYSHVTPESYQLILEEVGFYVEAMEHVVVGGETMLWVLVEKESK